MTEPLTDEQLEQVRAAAHKVENQMGDYGELLIAELTRPPIHPDVPVMYSTLGSWRNVAFFRDMPSIVTNISVLTPVSIAREIARETARLVENGCCIDEAMAEVDRDLDAYAQGETS